jgi:hypothetical protein
VPLFHPEMCPGIARACECPSVIKRDRVAEIERRFRACPFNGMSDVDIAENSDVSFPPLLFGEIPREFVSNLLLKSDKRDGLGISVAELDVAPAVRSTMWSHGFDIRVALSVQHVSGQPLKFVLVVEVFECSSGRA